MSSSIPPIQRAIRSSADYLRFGFFQDKILEGEEIKFFVLPHPCVGEKLSCPSRVPLNHYQTNIVFEVVAPGERT